jgi:phage terminase large subunit-like protein
MRGDWWWVARPEQIPPPGNWFVCLALAGRGWGKAIDVSTSIPVANCSTDERRRPVPGRGGFKKLGDLEVGDWVFDEAGKPCRVTATFDQDPEVAYRLTFNDGLYIDTCSEHQWVTWEHRDRKAYLRSQYESDTTRFPLDWPTWRPMKRHKSNPPYRDQEGPGPRIRTTQDLVDTLTYNARGDLNHSIPLTGALELPEVRLTVDPWLLGYWLGNGSTSAGTISGHLADIDHVVECVIDAGFDCLLRPRDGQWFTGTPGGLVSQLRHIDVLDNKHVPQKYLWASVEQRRALLAGLMDSDGYGEASKVEFCSITKELADGVMHLARSLGQRPYMHVGRAQLYGVDKGAKYRVSWRPTFNPFTSPRKMATYVPPDGQGLRTQHRMIIGAERIDPTPMRCITVDSPNSMYLVGEGLIPTHNSRSGSEWIVSQTIKHPYDSRGVPTEWLVIAETLSDGRTICMEGPAGILQVLNRRKIRHRYKMSPRPMVLFPSGTKIYTEGADDPDVGRGYNSSGAWLDEICIAKNEPILTRSGPRLGTPVQDVRVGDEVLTRNGYARVIMSRLTQPDAEVWEISTGGTATVRLTPDHRVWTDEGWRKVSELHVNDVVWTAKYGAPEDMLGRGLAPHHPVRISGIRRMPETINVYDITVEGDDPEFFAGSGRILVHNCKWKFPKKSWEEGIMPSLRADLAGDHPRAFVTTTPKPVDILQEWVRRGDGTVHLMRGSTFENASNLSSLVIEELRRRYEGTMVGRQELYGEIIEAFEGALFSRLDIENNRILDVPDDLVATVVGVDPSLTGEDDEMGIVVVGRDRQKHMYVLADRSIMSVGRAAALEAWRVVAEFGADKLVCEVNLGKKWMSQVFHDAYFELVGQGLFPAHTKPPIVGIDTKIGKRTRGEPVAMRCEQGRLHILGHQQELEDQMSTFVGWGTRDSPDRLDALVHACRFLMDGEKKEVRISSPRDALSSTLQSLWQDAGSYNYGF